MRYNIESDLLTVKEVSLFLKLSVLTVYKYIKERKLEAIEFGGHYRIERGALINFIKRHKVGNSTSNDNYFPQFKSEKYTNSNLPKESQNE